MIILLLILSVMTITGIILSHIDLRIQRRKRREALRKRLRTFRRNL